MFTDGEGEEIHSLAVRDVARRADEREPKLAGVPNITGNHTAHWQAIRSRIASQEACTKMIVRDDLKATGINTKHFTRWLQKLTDDGLVIQNGDHLTLHSHYKSG